MIVFKSPSEILVRTGDGRNVTLMEPIEFQTDKGVTYQVPIGATSDGASTPAALWPTIPPFGQYWKAAVVHDAAYRNQLQRQLESGFWVPAMLSKEDCDALFLDCMTALGVDQPLKDAIYEGVAMFGGKAFMDDRASLSPGSASPGG
jgi:hypothetical protein